MHTYVYEIYRTAGKGGDLQILNKMKAFWEYLLPNADRKLLKAIHKKHQPPQIYSSSSCLF